MSLADAQLSVALTWVRRGFPVIPCSRTDKGALVPGFGKSATADEMAPFADPEQVSRWWSSGRFARAHVGLLTGRGGEHGRGLVVVDLDMPKADTEPLTGRWAGCAGGSDVLELLMREAGAEWPDTYTVLTPSGGMHLYYQQPGDGDLIGCATGEGPRAPHLGPLVDVRGVGGYVIAAGSYSAAQGRPYTRVSAPELLPQPLPAWLLALLRPTVAPVAARRPTPVRQLPTGDRAERYATAALNGELDKVASAGEGERNRALYAAARRLGELSATAPAVLGETAVQDQLLAAAREAGVSEQEALRTIRSGWNAGSRAPMGGAA
ncbi:bifunctional DNA primase/polymerase (plasmid) [Streptomyces sp. NBC_01005]|uniref:bifunctional DNA primase/polymerase n=1 Tax=Streptomyces sp. NBC_01005 TaxID=2903715 RepID=UPI00386E6225|nr:bifunctional DNA primase/polymerase [Streptomyces sp. NBC_01005]WSW11545.1 bifunctional DNA primase/polymerase [Streptomyces sp. NBC_01005]